MKPLLGALLAFVPLAAGAHAFGQTYVLPLPFWMYAFAASAALALSFVIVGYFVLGIVMNAISRSKPERYTMAPLSVVLAVLALIVALIFAFGRGGSSRRNGRRLEPLSHSPINCGLPTVAERPMR